MLAVKYVNVKDYKYVSCLIVQEPVTEVFTPFLTKGLTS